MWETIRMDPKNRITTAHSNNRIQVPSEQVLSGLSEENLCISNSPVSRQLFVQSSLPVTWKYRCRSDIEERRTA